MKNATFLLASLSIALTTSTANAMPSVVGDFLGINVSMGGCRMQTADGSFSHMGPGETKLTTNNKMMIASCKAEYNLDQEEITEDTDEAIVVRTETPCKIAQINPDWLPKSDPDWVAGVKKMLHFDGLGGFTATSSGHVMSRCKVIK